MLYLDNVYGYIYLYTNSNEGTNMEYLTIFNQLREEKFNDTIALSAIQILTINISMKVSVKDIKEPRRFTEKLRKKAKSILWELSDTEFNLVRIVYSVLGDFMMRRSLVGLGGCVEKTITQLIGENNAI